jgi:hypothetical protein
LRLSSLFFFLFFSCCWVVCIQGINPEVIPSSFEENLDHSSFEDPESPEAKALRYAAATASEKAIDVYTRLVVSSLRFQRIMIPTAYWFALFWSNSNYPVIIPRSPPWFSDWGRYGTPKLFSRTGGDFQDPGETRFSVWSTFYAGGTDERASRDSSHSGHRSGCSLSYPGEPRLYRENFWGN